jgi:hypothetical protein
MNKLPYACKELINLFALDKIKDYETLQEFNKICNYEPCEYSDIKLRNAKFNYVDAFIGIQTISIKMSEDYQYIQNGEFGVNECLKLATFSDMRMDDEGKPHLARFAFVNKNTDFNFSYEPKDLLPYARIVSNEEKYTMLHNYSSENKCRRNGHFRYMYALLYGLFEHYDYNLKINYEYPESYYKILHTNKRTQ